MITICNRPRSRVGILDRKKSDRADNSEGSAPTQVNGCKGGAGVINAQQAGL